MIKFDDVTVTYGRRVVVDGFSAHVAAGEWVGLLGPNGAGKSSLLKAAVGIAEHRGVIHVETGTGRTRAQTIAYVPQEPLLPPDMTGLEYALLGRAPHVGYFASETARDRAVARAALERLDLGAFADRPLARMSGGERQRLVIARALATEAPVLLLDEPTSALDVGHQQQALDLIAELRAERGLTVVAAMHDLTLAGLYADRLLLLWEGRRVAEGPAAEVLTEENLAEYYGVRASVRIEDDGAVTFIPRRRPVR